MATLVNKKYVLSGKFLEIYIYEKPFLNEYQRKPRKPLLVNNKQPTSLSRRFFSLTRCRRQIRRIVNSNMDFNKFLTLTFAENLTDLDCANYEFKKFVQRIGYVEKDFKYLAVVEFQQRGSVHYHVICNLRYYKMKALRDLWNNGFIKLNRIGKVDNVGAYVCKYLQKDILDPRLNGRKVYFCSKNVTRPVEITSPDICKKIDTLYNVNHRVPEKEFSYSNEYVGNVDYSIYKL